MQVPLASLLISAIALLISVWTRIESIILIKRQRHQLIVAKAGEAFIAAQQLKNNLSYCIDQIKSSVKSNSNAAHIDVVFTDRLHELESVYKDIWEFISSMELVISAYESGTKAPLDPARLEAKIAHFKQWRELIDFDMKYFQERNTCSSSGTI